MQVDPHERARFLVDETLVAGISSEDEVWLRGHVEDCAECARFANAGTHVVRTLRSISFDVDPETNARVQRAMIARAESRRRGFFPRWSLVATAAIVLLVVPIQRSVVEGRRVADAEQAVTLLLDGVDSRVSRAVPLAMEPFVRAGSGDSQ